MTDMVHTFPVASSPRWYKQFPDQSTALTRSIAWKRFRAKKEQFKRFQGLLSESQDQNLALDQSTALARFGA